MSYKMPYTVCCVLVAVMFAGSALAAVTTVYNSGGFEAYTAGAISGQDGGKWMVGSGQSSDSGSIVNLGDGLHNKVLSFKQGQPVNVKLALGYQGNPANTNGTIVKWSYDFYQAGTVQGAVFSYRDAGATVVQAKLLPEVGKLNLELRKGAIDGVSWPSWITTMYALNQWNHVDIYQYNPVTATEKPGQVKVYLNGVEITRWDKWFSVWSYFTGYIGQIEFAPNLAADATYYVDNLVVEEGPEVTFPAATAVRTVYDSAGFEAFSTGTVDWQDERSWPDGSIRSPWILYSGTANIVALASSGAHAGRGKVLSFGNPSSQNNVGVDLWFVPNYLDPCNTPRTAGTTVKWEYDFYQEGLVYGAVYSCRNASSVRQVSILPQVGDLNVELRKGSVTGAWWPSWHVGSYDMSNWHHIEVYQFQPLQAVEEVGPARVWLDGVELTADSTYYTQWVYYMGNFYGIEFCPTNLDNGDVYYIDNLKVTEGPDVQLPQEQCGAWGYLPGDINKDCVVDLKDLSGFAGAWLGSTDLNNINGQNLR